VKHFDPNGPRVLKHPLQSRLFHWGLILGFMPAAITGFLIWLKPLNETLMNLAMQVHIVGAGILTISCVLYAVFCLDRVVAFIRLSFTWGKNDIEWMKVSGGYPQKMFLGKEIEVPPMDKVNSGQKIFGICLLLGGTFLIVSGWLLYAFLPFAPKMLSFWMGFGHLYLGLFLGLFMFVHIFLGVYNWGEFKAMFGDGTQPLEEARHHNPLWVQNKIETVRGRGFSENIDEDDDEEFDEESLEHNNI